jgi:hypothetical protein
MRLQAVGEVDGLGRRYLASGLARSNWFAGEKRSDDARWEKAYNLSFDLI